MDQQSWKRHYIALVTDPALHNEVLVFSVRERDPNHARRAIHLWYEDEGWPQKGISIRLVLLRGKKDVQLIGHAPTDKDIEAIRALCEEVLHIADNDLAVNYRDKLRVMVQAFDIGHKVFHDRYGEG